MTRYFALLKNLEALEAERNRISNEGDILFDCWLAPSKPGGTARTGKAHWQLRSRKAQSAGKKSKYIKASEVGQYEAAIDRGKTLRQLDKKIELLRKRIEQIDAIIASTEIVMPDVGRT
ncbi:hypothetical protein [Leptolyngbya sp. ST-U4]|uniref:hypothetical protein n=1 Tax=Leptolyngbya sp. ST-U4 TaxID=2933912 RepID=UPI0032975BF5